MEYSTEPIPNEAMPLVALGYARLQRDPRAISEPTSFSVAHVSYSVVHEDSESFCVQRHRNAGMVADWMTRKGSLSYALEVAQKNLDLQRKGQANLLAQEKPIQAWVVGYEKEIPKLEAMVAERQAALDAHIAAEPPQVPTVLWRFDRSDKVVVKTAEPPAPPDQSNASCVQEEPPAVMKPARKPKKAKEETAV